MKPTQLNTSEFARRFAVHPNTIRLYEVWGYLPPIPRDERGYRIFDERHVAQMELARMALKMPSAGLEIKESLKTLVWLSSGGELPLAQTHAHKHLQMIENAQKQAKIGLQSLTRGESGLFSDTVLPLNIRQAAQLIGISVPVLRRWENYGLIVVPQNTKNHYREYGAVELGWLHVIHTLRLVGYKIETCRRLLNKHDDLIKALTACQKTLAQHKKHILKVQGCLSQMVVIETRL